MLEVITYNVSTRQEINYMPLFVQPLIKHRPEFLNNWQKENSSWWNIKQTYIS